MNAPNDEEIEALLGRLSPASPDAALMARLRAAKPPKQRILRPVIWLPLAAAAAAALAFAIHETPQEEVAPPITETAAEAPPRTPVASRQHLMEVADLGVVNDASEQPVRLIRTTWLDEIYYVTRPGDAPQKESQIREEVMPIALSTY